jgi:hypothetical protein
MNRLHRWLSVSQATRKAALLCFSAVLWASLALAAAAPARADGCAYVTGGRAYLDSQNNSQQLTVHVGDIAQVRLYVRLSNGQTPYIPGSNLNILTNGAGPVLGNGTYLVVTADANKTFPLYVVYHDPCKNVNWTFTVSLHVLP